MKTRMNTRILRLILLVGLSVAQSAVASPAGVVLSSGTVVPVRLDQNLSSEHSMKGDTFTATVRSGYLGLPEGTRVQGVVRSAVVKTKKKPGVLVLEFTRILSPNGNRTNIDGSPVGLDSKSVTTGAKGRIVAKSGVKNKRLTYVGYGAGAGALVALLGGGKRILEDAAIGAALGYLVGSLEKGGNKRPNNVTLKEGTSMGVLLHKKTTVRF